ncbi:hypothetical protein LQW54_008164 [Pestalotiopsis sp. IQ-011]
MELRGVLILAAAVLPAVVINAAPLEAAQQQQHTIDLQAGIAGPDNAAAEPARASPPRKLHGRFLHITEAGYACHRGKGPAGYYGAETSDCDTPHSLVNATFNWIDEHLKDNIDFIIWTGDSARHDSDDKYDRSEKDVIRSNRMIADKFVSTLSDDSGLTIPIIPNFGNNDILPHNIMVGGPSKWLKRYTDIWKSFVPESQRHTFELGGWFYTEVIPNKLAVFSLNTLYFFNRNAGVDDCVHPSEPGFKQMEWLRIQLQFLRNRGMKAILMGHVPPARTSGKENWDETCWQKYTLWLQQYRDVIVGSLYGHMNIDHFFLQDTRDINLNYFKTSSEEYKTYVKEKRHHGKKKPKVHLAGNVNQEGFYIRSGADYLSELREDWGKLPKAAIHASSDDSLEADGKKKKDKKKKKPKKDPLGSEWAERYQLSLVSPSIVPNYFPTIRVFEYNITGLENSPTWRDVIRDSKPGQGEHMATGFEDLDFQIEDLDLETEDLDLEIEDTDLEIEKKKHKKKKGKKGKPEKDPYLIVPEPPSPTTLPGPAYSPQPLTLTGYTQYFANLTYLNNDAHDFVKKGTHEMHSQFGDEVQPDHDVEDPDFSHQRWNEGVHKGKKPGHKPKPRPFQFDVEYSTFDDELYKLKDLTVGNMLKLAYRIGQVGAKSKALAEDFADSELDEGMDRELVPGSDENDEDEYEDDVGIEDDEDADDDSDDDDSENDDDTDADSDDEDELESALKGKKKKGKGKKGKKGKKPKRKNKVWLHFLRHAFVSTASEKDLKKV